jgi:HD-like signal output (HDOD) protein/CheY-like chemotaxis protein
MPTILIIDPSAFCRELLTALLEPQGYTVSCAGPDQALAAFTNVRPSILLLEPGDARFAVLEAIHHEANGGHIPVVVLTDLNSREAVLRAGQLGVRDYMLKDRFSTVELLSRLRKYLVPSSSGTGVAAAAPAANALPSSHGVAASRPSSNATADEDCMAITAIAAEAGIPLLNRKRMIQRVESANVKSLPGIISEVIAMVSSPRGSVLDLAQTLKRDPMLAARVLRLSNSAAFASQRSRISNIEDAVRHIGINGVRNLVVSIGVFESFGPGVGDAVGMLRALQHALGVAELMERLTPITDASPNGVPYVVGLCHDLADLILRQHFPEEYTIVLDLMQRSGRPKRQVESVVYGLPYNELVAILLSRMGLPGVISAPIEEFFERGVRKQASGAGSILGRALRLANVYAHGLLLAVGTDEPVTPLTKEECRNTMGDTETKIDDETVRLQALNAASVLAGSGTDAASAFESLIPQQTLRVCYLRQEQYAEIDPLHSLLKLATRTVTVRTAATAGADFAEMDALVVAAKRGSTVSDVQSAIETLANTTAGRPVLYLSGLDRADLPSVPENISLQRLPVDIRTVADFLSRDKRPQSVATAVL